MPRINRIYLTLALGLALAIASQFLSFTQFQYAIYESEGLPEMITSLARLQTALGLMTLAGLGSIFLPHTKEN